MEPLYELETQADEFIEFIVERMRRTIAAALSLYKPMRQERHMSTARHRCYKRTPVTKYGAMRLDVTMFRCGDCGAMRGGMDVTSKEQALYWRVKALGKGLTYLRLGEPRYRVTWLLDRFNRGIRAREWMGAVWTGHNL